jgi:hypothetical protein
MRMPVAALASALLLAAGVAFPQAPGSSSPCRTPEARQFDFWLGTWDLTGRARAQPGSDRWGETRSTNTIRSTMNGCVTREEFENVAPTRWTGMSVSVWNPRSHQWHQTWVDSQGSYIPLTGAFQDGRMILVTPARALPTGDSIVNRMVFHDIARDSLVWDWEASRDGGRTWELLWSILYRRRK